MDREQAIRVLGLQEPFALEDVTKAFKRLIWKTHPDRGGSEEDFKTLNEAKAYIIKFFDKKSEPKPFIKNQWGKETPVRIIVRLTFSWSLLDIINGVNKTHSIGVDGKIVQFHYNEPPRKVKKFRGIEKRIVRTVSGIQMIIITHEIANVSVPFYKLEMVNDYDLKLTVLEKTDQKYLKFFDDRIFNLLST